MALFDTLLTGEIARRRKIGEARKKALADPTKMQDLLAKGMKSQVPEGRKIRTKKHPTKLAATEAAIPKGDPRSGMGVATWNRYTGMMDNPAYKQFAPRDLMIAASEIEFDKVREPTHRYIQKQKTGTFSTFMKEEYAPMLGQEEWEARPENAPPIAKLKAEESFAYGAGFAGLVMVGKSLGLDVASKLYKLSPAKKAALRTALETSKRNPWIKLAVAGGAAIPSMIAYEQVQARSKVAMMKTKVGQEHPLAAEITSHAMGLATGLVGFERAALGVFARKGVADPLPYIKKLKDAIFKKDTAGEAAMDNPAAKEILEFKKATLAAEKASDKAVATMDKDKAATMKRLVGTLESRVAKEKTAAIPLSGAVARRGIFTPEGLEAMRKVGRVPTIPAEGVIKYTPEELAKAKEKVAIAIEQGTPNLPMLKPDGSLLSLGSRKVVPYGYNNIKSEKAFDRVLSEVVGGKKKAVDAVQFVGEMEEGIARHSKVIPLVKVTPAVKKVMSQYNYDAEEVKGLNEKIFANIKHFSKKEEKSALLDRALRESVPQKKESIVDLSGLSTEEKLYNFAKTRTPQQRLDLVESGTISEAINRRIVKEQKALIEGKPEYKAFTVKEAEADAEFLGSMGTGGVPKEDGSYLAKKADFLLGMKGDKGVVSPKALTGLAVSRKPASKELLEDAGFLPREIQSGVSTELQEKARSGYTYYRGDFVPVTEKMVETKASAVDKARKELDTARNTLASVSEKVFWEKNLRGKLLGIDARGEMSNVIPTLKERLRNAEAGLSRYERQMKRLTATKEKASPMDTLAEKALGAIAAAATTFTLADIFSPAEAEAAGIVDLGRTLSGLTATILKDAKPGKVKDLIKEMKASGMIAKSQVDHCYVLPEPRKSLNIIPNVKDVSKKKSMPPGAEAVVSPHVQFLYYTGVREGQELMNNAGVQWGSCQGSAVWNSVQGHKTLMSILEDFIPNYKSSAKRAIEVLKPIVEKYHVPMQERAFHLGMARDFKRSYEKALSQQAKKRKFKKEADFFGESSTIARLEALYKEHDVAYKASTAMKDEYQAAWTKAMIPFASKAENSGTRIFLLAEDTADFKHYPWLKDIATWEERAAAAKLKDMMEQYSARVIEAGEKVITDRPFMHHPWHPAMKSELARLNKGATLMSPPMTKLHSRSAGYMPMVPDAEYSVTSYLQDINIRLEAMEFWKKGEKNGWWAYKKWLTENPSQAPEGLVKAFNQFEKGFKPVDTSGGFNKFSEKVYAFEVARLLAFSASVPFKHALKLVADLRVFGMEGVKAMPKAASSIVKVAIKQRGGEEWLKKRGFGLDYMDEAVETYTETGKLYRVVSDISPFRVNESMADKAIGKFNEIGGTPTSIVERFDRALSTVAGIRMAAKRGMTPAQSTYAIFDTILKSNFLSGQLNPSWLRNPAIRLMMIFQGTPFKIMEQRIALHGRAWKGVGDTLKQLRRDVIQGEQDFKWEMIKQGFGKQKDIFGNTLLSQSIREMILVGTGITAAKYVWDGDLSHHFFHPPFFKAQRRDIAIGASPLVNASVETYAKYMDEDYDDFVVSTFFNSWFDATYKGIPAPIPVNFKKAARLSENDIPEIYRDSKLRYLFGIPATHD